MQNYNTIIGVIQMRQDNCPSRSIMERYRIGSGTVSLIINRYASSGLSLQQLQQMSPKDVENTFYPQKNLQRKEIAVRWSCLRTSVSMRPIPDSLNVR